GRRPHRATARLKCDDARPSPRPRPLEAGLSACVARIRPKAASGVERMDPALVTRRRPAPSPVTPLRAPAGVHGRRAFAWRAHQWRANAPPQWEGTRVRFAYPRYVGVRSF